MPSRLAELTGARWFQGKGRELASLEVAGRVVLTAAPGAALEIVSVSYVADAAEEYLLALRREAGEAERSAEADDPLWAVLARLALEGDSVAGERGRLEGVPGPARDHLPEHASCRPLEADQSNTSLVLDGRVVLKCYRRLEPGRHPEHELLEGLTRVGSSSAPALLGALRYRSSGCETTLAIAYAHVPGAPVGWEAAIEQLSAALGGPTAELERLASETAALGHCAGALHRDLRAALGSRVATAADAQLERARAETELHNAIAVVSPVAPELAALGPAAEAALAGLDRLPGTTLQRIHGDLHVAQLLRSSSGIVAIDFEGDPTLPSEERRRLASPLQDVASLLLSLDHVAAAAARRRGFGASAEKALAWSALARAAVLEAYGEVAPAGTIDPALLRALEVEKEWREAVYATRVLPEWLYAPRLVLQKLLV